MDPVQGKTFSEDLGDGEYSFFLNGHTPEQDGRVASALEDFRDRSGLSAEILHQAQVRIFRGNPDRLKDLLNFSSLNGQSILSVALLVEIPSFSFDGEVSGYHFRLYPAAEGRRYLHAKDRPARPYILNSVWATREKANRPLWITEGAKKCLKLIQHGRQAIGVQGVWNFRDSNSGQENFLFDDLEQFNWRGRTVYIGFDLDLWVNPQVRFALFELAFKLKSRGAVIRFPKWFGGKGIDDHLVMEENPEEALVAIEDKALALEKFISPDHGEEVLRALKLSHQAFDPLALESLATIVAKRLSIRPKRLLDELQKERFKTPTCISAYFPELVDLVHDDNGGVAYLVVTEKGLTIAETWEHNGNLNTPPEADYLPFQLVKGSDVIPQYGLEDTGLCDDLISHLKRFSYLSDAHWLMIACKVFLSYLQDHPDIYYLPMILFYAQPERGKSRTGKAVSHLCFRGIQVVDLREANLLRFSQNLRATIFFDLKNLWKKAEENGAEDILLLRYEKGAKASRVIYPEKGAFKDMVHYEIYGPTLMATNEAVHKILDTRCIPITMPNKPGDYENPTPEMAGHLKIRLTAWRAKWMQRSLPRVDTIKGLQGRLWDISKPLLQVCRIVAPTRYEELKYALLEIAGQRIEDQKESLEGQIVQILGEHFPENVSECTFKTGEILDSLNESRPEKYKISSQALGKKLKAMGIRTRHVHGYSEFVLLSDQMKTLLTQFNFSPPPENSLPHSTFPENPGIFGEKAGRELVESCEHSTSLQAEKTVAKQGDSRVVESGRESNTKESILESAEEAFDAEGELLCTYPSRP